jgi:hypothetical protein
MKDPNVNMDQSKCNPWKINQPEKGGGAADIRWAPQVTAPLPLEAISDLFSYIVTKSSSNDRAAILLPSQNPSSQMVYVTKDFFQSKPNGISSDSVKAGVLGFSRSSSRTPNRPGPKTKIKVPKICHRIYLELISQIFSNK